MDAAGRCRPNEALHRSRAVRGAGRRVRERLRDGARRAVVPFSAPSPARTLRQCASRRRRISMPRCRFRVTRLGSRRRRRLVGAEGQLLPVKSDGLRSVGLQHLRLRAEAAVKPVQQHGRPHGDEPGRRGRHRRIAVDVAEEPGRQQGGEDRRPQVALQDRRGAERGKVRR